MTSPARMKFTDLSIGQTAAFEVLVSHQDLDRFIELSGDNNPLHADSEFARARGFVDRVVHGAYIAALVSRLVGVHLPGENCIVHSMNLQFKAPLVVGRRAEVQAVIDQLSDAVQAAILKITVTDLDAGQTVATGKVNLGFTAEVA
ncbi:MAG: MaoC/PaaZ C-terminal domain-containing protein [Pseudomonadota bacterium]